MDILTALLRKQIFIQRGPAHGFEGKGPSNNGQLPFYAYPAPTQLLFVALQHSISLDLSNETFAGLRWHLFCYSAWLIAQQTNAQFHKLYCPFVSG
jgi:hypothetical protein